MERELKRKLPFSLVSTAQQSEFDPKKDVATLSSANNESKGCGNNFEGKNRMKIFSNLTVSTKFLLSRYLCKPAEKSKCPLISKQQSEQKYEKEDLPKTEK